MSQLLEIAYSVQDEARRVAASVKSSRRRFCRTPEMAAVIIGEATGGGCWPPETILNSSLPRLMLGDKRRTMLFADEDILGMAERLLDEALVLTPAPSGRIRKAAKPADQAASSAA
jgi:hypothetical protein